MDHRHLARDRIDGYVDLLLRKDLAAEVHQPRHGLEAGVALAGAEDVDLLDDRRWCVGEDAPVELVKDGLGAANR